MEKHGKSNRQLFRRSIVIRFDFSPVIKVYALPTLELQTVFEVLPNDSPAKFPRMNSDYFAL